MMRSAWITSSLLAAALAVSAGASTGDDPSFDDLSVVPSRPTDIAGASLMRAGLGDDYRSLTLMGALDAVQTAISEGKQVDAAAQEALVTHRDAWRAAYHKMLSQAPGAAGEADFDDLFNQTMNEQLAPEGSQVRAYGEVADQLDTLYKAITRYHIATSLERSGRTGFTTTKGRSPDAEYLDDAQMATVESYSRRIGVQITAGTRRLQDILNKG